MAYQSFVDHAFSALPRVSGPGIDYIGDLGNVGPEISPLRRAGRTLRGVGPRGILRAATGPVPLAVAALQPLASATAKQQVASGQYTEPGVTKAIPGAYPGRAIDVRGISNTNPFTGSPVTNYKNEIQSTTSGLLPPTMRTKPAVAPWVANPGDWSQVPPETNSVTPIPPLDVHGSAVVDGNRVNYEDIGNPLKDAALINSKGYSFGSIPAETSASQTTGGAGLDNILKTIQAIQPVEDYAHRVSALNTGNTTWDMNGLSKILAAKAGQQADVNRYTQQTGALAHLGSAQMNAEAAKVGHEMQLRGEREKNAYLAPYYAAEAEKNKAEAGSAPLRAKADILKVLNEQAKDDPVLKASLDVMTDLAKRGDAAGYNAYAAKLALLTGKLIPKMPVED